MSDRPSQLKANGMKAFTVEFLCAVAKSVAARLLLDEFTGFAVFCLSRMRITIAKRLHSLW
ncbi:hypothetical protein ACG7TL_008887 [Trametes sanguinea]